MVANAITNLFLGEDSSSQKIINLLVLLFVILAVVFALESAMGLVTIGRLERQVNLLNELNALSEKGLGSHRQLVHLDNAFNEAVRDLEQYNTNLTQIVQKHLPEFRQVSWIKTIPGALVWILLGLLTLRTTKGGFLQKSMGCAVMSGFGLAISYVLAGMIPTSNALVAAILSFCGGLFALVFLVVIGIALTSRKQPVTKEEEQPEN